MSVNLPPVDGPKDATPTIAGQVAKDMSIPGLPEKVSGDAAGTPSVSPKTDKHAANAAVKAANRQSVPVAAAEKVGMSKALDYKNRPEWLKESIQENFERLTSEGTRYASTGSECYAFCDCQNSLGLGGGCVQAVRSDQLVANALKRVPADQLKVLDLGAGDGMCLRELKEGREDLNDVKIEGGVNVSATAYREPSDEYRVHDVERLFDPSGAGRGQSPIERGKFHVVISCMTFIHLKDPAGALQQAYEALAEGGVLAVDSLVLRGLGKQELNAMMSNMRAQGYSIYGGAHAEVDIDTNKVDPNGPSVSLDGLNPVIIRKSREHPTLELPLRYKESASWSPTRMTYELTCSKEAPELTVSQKKLTMARASGDDSQVATTAQDAILCGDMQTLRELVKAKPADAECWVIAQKCGNDKALQILGPPTDQATKALDELRRSDPLEKK